MCLQARKKNCQNVRKKEVEKLRAKKPPMACYGYDALRFIEDY